jgi:hypothetical protein
MKRAKTRKRGGTPSKCISLCSYQCEGNCRKLCNVSKSDFAYHKYNFLELQKKKEKLVDKLEAENKGKLVDLLKDSKLSTKEQEDLKKILTNSEIGFSSKQLLLKLHRDKNTPLLFQIPKQGGFNFLSNRRSYSECETDCKERCSESCEYLCGESVNKLSSMYKKESDLLETEISILEEVNKLIRVV